MIKADEAMWFMIRADQAVLFGEVNALAREQIVTVYPVTENKPIGL